MNPQDAKRWLVAAGLAAAVLLAWMGTVESPVRKYSVDASAQVYVDQGLRRALVTFAAARGLNAVLSFVQSADLSFQPLGVGIEVGPGQLVRPVNDLVSQFAELMLTASIVFVGMEVFIRIGEHWLVTLALTVAGAGLASCHVRRRRAPPWLARAFVIMLVIRFAVPTVSIGNEAVYRLFMADDYAVSQNAIQASSERIEAAAATAAATQEKDAGKAGGGLFRGRPPAPPSGAQPPPESPKGETGALQGLKDWITQAGDVPARLERVKQAAEDVIEHVIRLMVVFLLQTLVMPLLIGWVVLRVAVAASRWGASGRE